MSTRTNSGAGVLAANSAFTIPFTVITGRSLIVALNHETALNGITGLTDSGANTWVQDYSDTAPGGEGRRVFRCQTVGTVPTTLTCASSTAGTIHYVVVEATGLNVTPYEDTKLFNESANTTTHSATFTSANANDLAVVLVLSNTDAGTITPSTGFTEIADSRNARAAFYKEDLGAAGAQTLGYTSSSTNTAKHLIALYKSAVVDPTVSTVTSSAVAEGSAKRYTVTLSAATARDVAYVAAFSGTATSADYDTNLSHTGGHATYSNSVTFAAGSMTVPTGVSSFTVDVNTTQDALDEAAETIILTVGGVASTGDNTITDDDAAPSVSVSDATEVNGILTFTVSLSAASGQTLTVDYATADGVKLAGTNYTAASGTLTFLAGETTKTVDVTVL